MPEDLNALDRELSELLAVEPSPEFAAKVRARIERQPETTFGWRHWMGAAVAAAVIIAVVLAMVGRRAPQVRAPLTAPRDVHLSPKVDPVTQTPAAVSPSPDIARARHAERRERAPEVLVDPALAAAVRRLTTEQRVLPEMPPEPSLLPVVVQPLKVPEIADSGNKQGDRQ
jgi:hypothetical protein